MLEIAFEDDYLLVVNKQAGVLSQPGKTMDGSILSQVKEAYPHASGPLLVHRLDMDTSGLLILAKCRDVHRLMQQQFEKRQVRKRYEAVVSGVVEAAGGKVSLPLRLDINNRPMQIVCTEYGKRSTTLWRKLDSMAVSSRLALYPLTGRTHQLRVHLSDSRGLGLPIVGDRLYGQAQQRMLLHAMQLDFMHPFTGKSLCLKSDVPF